MATIYNQPAAEYHADSAISHSRLKVFADSRRKYEAQFITNTLAPKSTTEMDLGTVAHAAILEPHIIDDVCIEIPRDVLSSNGARYGKAWHEWSEAHSDRIQLKADDLAFVRGMFEAVYRNRSAKRLLESPGRCEACIKWDDNECGLTRRVRLDKLIPCWGIVDVKTCTSIKERALIRSVADFGYATQEAYYEDANVEAYDEWPHFAFVFVEQKPPHLVRVKQLRALREGDDAIQEARQLNMSRLRALAECLRSGDWSDPGEHDIQYLNLPPYCYGANENDASDTDDEPTGDHHEAESA